MNSDNGVNVFVVRVTDSSGATDEHGAWSDATMRIDPVRRTLAAIVEIHEKHRLAMLEGDQPVLFIGKTRSPAGRDSWAGASGSSAVGSPFPNC